MIEIVSWDMLLTIGEVLTLIGPITTLRNPDAYVPRIGSGSLAFALVLMVVALFGLGAPIGASMTALVAAVWVAVFAFRGRKTNAVH